MMPNFILESKVTYIERVAGYQAMESFQQFDTTGTHFHITAVSLSDAI